MSTVPDPRIERVARDIAEGRDVDVEVTPDDSAETAALLAGLRTVEQVARVHRQMLDAGAAAATHVPGAAPLFHWGPFEVLEPIGAGSFGEVFRARDPALGREVALKLRRADEPGGAFSSNRWLDEARRLAAVRHPNVVHVYGAAVHEDRAGMWMELISGVTLEARLDSQGPMGWKETCLVGMELCAALAAVHGAGLVHNDIKLANVMRSGMSGRLGGGADTVALGGSGRIVLMDLGAGGAAGESGARMGTPLATAPEVLLGSAPGVVSDLWSLGALLYRLVAGKTPFAATTMAGLVEQARRGEMRSLRDLRPELPVAFVGAVERALATDPAARFGSAADFERALAHALDLPVTAAAASRPRRTGRSLALAAALLATLGIATFAALRSSRSLETLTADHSASSPAASPPPATGAANSNETVVPAAPAAPVVRARFVRTTSSGAETLESGDLVVPGDQLALEVDAEEPLWFYVYNEDRSGAVSELFPVEGLDLQNPLKPGRNRLPGPSGGSALDWQVTSTGGDETFLFIASPHRLPEVEQRMAAATQVAAGRAIESAPGTTPSDSYRGVAGLAPSRAPVSAHAGALQTLERELGSARVWLKHIELRNPGR